jgi:HEPN domain-containing protein
MPRKPLDADDPRRWMSFAKSDLKLARNGRMPGIRLEGLCYLAQQAAEKAIKAVLMRKGVHFPKIHHIQALLGFLPKDLAVPHSVREAVDLSDYAVEGRYPQNFEDITEEEYLSALKKAGAVVRWAEKTLK